MAYGTLNIDQITGSGAGSVIINNGTSNVAGFTTGNNLQMLQNGGGIVFSNSSATTNSTLNDYETGTWTPTLLGSSSNPTVTYNSANKGTYTKIGNLVFVQCYFRFSSFSGGSGSALIGGLPFTGASNNTNGTIAPSEWNSAFPSSSTYPIIGGEFTDGASYITLLRNGATVAGTNITISNLSSTDTYLIFSGSYIASF